MNIMKKREHYNFKFNKDEIIALTKERYDREKILKTYEKLFIELEDKK